jgi:hypothetical protein
VLQARNFIKVLKLKILQLEIIGDRGRLYGTEFQNCKSNCSRPASGKSTVIGTREHGSLSYQERTENIGKRRVTFRELSATLQ